MRFVSLTEFTEDRAELNAGDNGTESGFGKLLYEAVARALDQLKDVEGPPRGHSIQRRRRHAQHRSYRRRHHQNR